MVTFVMERVEQTKYIIESKAYWHKYKFMAAPVTRTTCLMEIAELSDVNLPIATIYIVPTCIANTSIAHAPANSFAPWFLHSLHDALFSHRIIEEHWRS